MKSSLSLVIKLVLLAVILFLAYKLFSIIQEPIQFEKLKSKRYDAVKVQLEQIRDAQKEFRSKYNAFAPDINTLIGFVDSGKVEIIERKDSTFTYFNETYQQEMEKDTIIKKLLGYQSVKSKVFDENFDASQLRYIPYSNKVEFMLDAGKINVNDVVVPVFEAVAPDSVIFHDVLDKYDQYIDDIHVLQVGSMTEPKLSGNWK